MLSMNSDQVDSGATDIYDRGCRFERRVTKEGSRKNRYSSYHGRFSVMDSRVR